MYRVVIFMLTLAERIVTNTYISGISCSIIAVIIIYKWQVWYSKRKLKQDFRCNECIEGIYQGIEEFCKYAPSVPKREEWMKDCDYTEFRRKNAKKYVDFYQAHMNEIYITNLALSYEGNDLLLESIQSCFWINLNFKLLGILNHIKNRLPNLRKKYPEIEKLNKQYKKTNDVEILIRLGETLSDYFTDAKFMAVYWKELLDYLGYDPTFIKVFIKVYNERYKLKEEMELPMKVRNRHIVEISRKVRKAIFKNKVKNFWKKIF